MALRLAGLPKVSRSYEQYDLPVLCLFWLFKRHPPPFWHFFKINRVWPFWL